MKQTKLRTLTIKPNYNISLPVGTAFAVKKYSEKLDFENIFSRYKKKGIGIIGLIEAMITYRLTENQSTSRASDWINRTDVLNLFELSAFEERTLFRVLEIAGDNYEEIIHLLQITLFKLYDFPHTDINMDWTSFVLWGTKAELGEYGYSRAHRPDKKQITVGISQLGGPINIPVGLTVQTGNTNDQTHFKKTFLQVCEHLKLDSMVVFDKGAQSKDNLDLVLAHKMKYLSAKKLNKSDDKRIKSFIKSKENCIDEEKGIHGIIIEYPSRFDYFFFSEQLKRDQIEAKLRMAEHKLTEAKEIQSALGKGKPLPARFLLNNPLVDITYSYQTKLKDLTEEQARKLVQSASISGREGFFCLVSCEKLTLSQALKIYRMKDSIEKVFQSLKNDINIKPLRVWTTKSLCGAILIGFLAQLVISLMRYDYKELSQVAPKFIKISLMNLTVTIEMLETGRKKEIYSNFDTINTLILTQKAAGT
ncbi:transposase [Candidatus Woesearchaeota archaeon]|uniref:IS1634 family transposase n=1 Tax=Methanobacterium sp. TaxID=2164 RepID=UPI0025D26AA0|nr:transposase [Methanobacterium sp.]MBI4981457.1 transposase [Candidatus Woesearchaeota archaeon]MBI5459331.1 transposase [Methanobacterium sp.]